MIQASRRAPLAWFSSLAMVILGVAFLAGCGPDPSQMIKEARKLDDQFKEAFTNEDLETIASLYWDDDSVVMMAPAAMILKGHKAVTNDFKSFFDGTKVQSFEFQDREYRVHGDVVVGWGTFKLVTDPSLGAPVSAEGRYTEVIGERDGKYVYLVDHASMPLKPGKGASALRAVESQSSEDESDKD